MISSISPTQSRSLAIGLLLVVVVAIGMFIAVPLVLIHAHYDGPLQSMAQNLIRFQHIVGNRDAVETALRQIRASQGDRFFLRSRVDALAASEVQEIAQKVIESSGGKLTRMQVISAKEESGYHRVGVSVQLESTMTALRRILYTIETGKPYLFVDNVTIQARDFSRRRGRAASVMPGVEPVSLVQFDLSGYARVKDQL